jgi:gas vesicle protein
MTQMNSKQMSSKQSSAEQLDPTPDAINPSVASTSQQESARGVSVYQSDEDTLEAASGLTGSNSLGSNLIESDLTEEGDTFGHRYLDNEEPRKRHEGTTSEHLGRQQDNRSPDDLEHDIGQTQERIAGNIDELAKRLNPSYIKDQAVQSLNESFNIPGLKYLMGDMKKGVGGSLQSSGLKVLGGVKQNPASAALVGVGLGIAAIGGIVAARTDPNQVYSSKPTIKAKKVRTYDERLRDMMTTIENKKDSSEDTYGESSSSKLSETVQSAKGAVTEGIHKAGETLQGAKDSVLETAQQVKETTLHGAQRTKEGLSHLLEAQPLAIGAVALLAGAAIGLLLPKTNYEDSVMGQKSDELISQARGKANEVVGAAKDTMNSVVQTAKDTVGEVVQTAKDTAKETVKAATA